MASDYVSCLEGRNGKLYQSWICLNDIKNLEKPVSSTEKLRYFGKFCLDKTKYPINRLNLTDNVCYKLWIRYERRHEGHQINLSKNTSNTIFDHIYELKKNLYSNLRRQSSLGVKIILARFTDNNFTQLYPICDGDPIHKLARYYHSDTLLAEIKKNPVNTKNEPRD